MPAFGNVLWPAEYGYVAGTFGLASSMLESTSSTNGTADSLSYTPVTTGLFRISTGAVVTQASDAATSHTIVAQVAYNDGSAISAENVAQDGVTTGVLNGKTLNANFYQSTVVRAVAGTTITVNFLHTVTGAKTAGVGKYAVMLTIERVQ